MSLACKDQEHRNANKSLFRLASFPLLLYTLFPLPSPQRLGHGTSACAVCELPSSPLRTADLAVGDHPGIKKARLGIAFILQSKVILTNVLF